MKNNFLTNKKIVFIITFIMAIICIVLTYSLNKRDNLKTYSKGHSNKQYKAYKIDSTTSLEQDKNKVINATYSYYCGDKSMKLKGNQCYYVSSIDAIKSYECVQGVYSYSKNSCEVSYIDSDYNVQYEYYPAVIKYSCIEGYTLNETKCEKEYSVVAIKKFSCPSNYYLNGDKCIYGN